MSLAPQPSGYLHLDASHGELTNPSAQRGLLEQIARVNQVAIATTRALSRLAPLFAQTAEVIGTVNEPDARRSLVRHWGDLRREIDHYLACGEAQPFSFLRGALRLELHADPRLFPWPLWFYGADTATVGADFSIRFGEETWIVPSAHLCARGAPDDTVRLAAGATALAAATEVLAAQFARQQQRLDGALGLLAAETAENLHPLSAKALSGEPNFR